jgi:predicted S18 family serine protease
MSPVVAMPRTLPLALAAVALAALTAGCLDGVLSLEPETLPIVATGDSQAQASVSILTLGVVESRRGSDGIVTPATVTVKAAGTGQILIQSPYGVAQDTRQSIIDAARASSAVARVDAAAYDYVVRLDEDSGPMSGPSAGSQWALGFYVALHNLLDPEAPLAVLESYAGTGTITAKGAVGEVGGVADKAEAAADHREGLFVYPDGPVYAEEGWIPQRVDMDGVCDDLALRCVQVATLAELVRVATVAA